MNKVREANGTSALAHELAIAEVEGLKRLVAVLDKYDSDSEEDFSAVVDCVLNGRFQPTELADEFRVSLGTISRWRAGKSAPITYARGVIVGRIREMLGKTASDKSIILRVVTRKAS
ncbi:MAG: hypothetical protein ABL973_11180 [Micropepsaceae bacterium]